MPPANAGVGPAGRSSAQKSVRLVLARGDGGAADARQHGALGAVGRRVDGGGADAGSVLDDQRDRRHRRVVVPLLDQAGDVEEVGVDAAVGEERERGVGDDVEVVADGVGLQPPVLPGARSTLTVSGPAPVSVRVTTSPVRRVTVVVLATAGAAVAFASGPAAALGTVNAAAVTASVASPATVPGK